MPDRPLQRIWPDTKRLLRIIAAHDERTGPQELDWLVRQRAAALGLTPRFVRGKKTRPPKERTKRDG